MSRLSRNERDPDLVDVEVGRRIRLQRVARGMSQSDLGKEIGVTFQQVQKYEKGVNRIGAGRLTRIAKVLGVPVRSFFSDGNLDANADPSESLELSYLVVPGALRLVKAYSQIKDINVRRTLVDLVEATASARK